MTDCEFFAKTLLTGIFIMVMVALMSCTVNTKKPPVWWQLMFIGGFFSACLLIVVGAFGAIWTL